MASVTLEMLHRAWLKRLRDEWQGFNKDKLGNRLKLPVFLIDRTSKRLGHWDAQQRTLGISEQHIWQHPWLDVLETLKHEMAHQYVSEVLGIHDETSHGHAFRDACRLLDCLPQATATPGYAPESETDRMLQKVKKLLALAESPNVNEAEAAMAAAHALILRYNLDVAKTAQSVDYAWRRIGATAAAIGLDSKLVGSILSRWFFVECVWVSVYVARNDRMERQLEVLGTHTNLELAHYAHDFLHAACESLWRAHARAGVLGTRREFTAGVLTGFSQKLESERKVYAGRGLVWLGDPALGGFVKERYRRLRSMTSTGVRQSEAHEAGVSAGQKLRIHQGMHTHGNSGRTLGSE
jgi:hypothetical protein